MDIELALQDRRRYKAVFSKLRRKARQEPYRLNSSPVFKPISLEWVLRSEKEITRSLLRQICKRNYLPSPASCNEVSVDKKRILYSMAWPDRICEAVLAGIIAEIIEPKLNSRLFSFRSGLSNLQAVNEAAKFFSDGIKLGPLFILKLDVSQYGESIDQEILFRKLHNVLGEQSEYTFSLLKSFLAPYYRTVGKQKLNKLKAGIPAGFALTPVCENLYLSELDDAMSLVEGLFYCRFGDDILAVHSDPGVVDSVKSTILGLLDSMKLTVKKEKQRSVVIGSKLSIDVGKSVFHAAPSIDYLGFRIDPSGKDFLITQ